MVPSQHKRLARWFYVAHGLTLMFALGFALTATFTSIAEKNSVGIFDSDELKVKISPQLVVIYYIVCGTLVLTACIGISAQIKGNKPCFWIIYCTLMGLMTLVELSVGGSAVSKRTYKSSVVLFKLRDTMEGYSRNGKNVSLHNRHWDKVHAKYKCCGLNNYTDWQSVQFGRTSLRVPTSCCLPQFKKDPLCGLNLLPYHENDSKLIYVRGCYSFLTEDLNLHLTVMGAYAVVVSIIQLLLLGTVSYLMMTKRL